VASKLSRVYSQPLLKTAAGFREKSIALINNDEHCLKKLFEEEMQACRGIRRAQQRRKKLKGRDLGYALAVSSCEGADRVESCTITALDVITAFAATDPSYILAEQPVFSGQFAFRVAPACGSPSLLRTG